LLLAKKRKKQSYKEWSGGNFVSPKPTRGAPKKRQKNKKKKLSTEVVSRPVGRLQKNGSCDRNAVQRGSWGRLSRVVENRMERESGMVKVGGRVQGDGWGGRVSTTG